jgi:hypothetical protein
MPDLRNRAEIERFAAGALANLQNQHRARLWSLLGDPPRFSNIPDSEWRRIEEETAALLLLLLYPIHRQSDLTLSAQMINRAPEQGPQLYQQAALGADSVQWARGHAETIARQTTDTAKERLREKIEAAAREEASIAGQLATAGLLLVLGAGRAAALAVDGTTRAASAGEFAARDRLSTAGVEIEGVWRAENDESTCRVCRRLDGQPYSVWGNQFPNGPGAHNWCRCWIDWR